MRGPSLSAERLQLPSIAREVLAEFLHNILQGGHLGATKRAWGSKEAGWEAEAWWRQHRFAARSSPTASLSSPSGSAWLRACCSRHRSSAPSAHAGVRVRGLRGSPVLSGAFPIQLPAGPWVTGFPPSLSHQLPQRWRLEFGGGDFLVRGMPSPRLFWEDRGALK